jgi:uncharacterized protein (UPF0332 family)
MHENLLRQARRLVQLDPKRPDQANLRRAVSAAYYALFHFLIDQSCRSVIGARHDQRAYRQVLGRAFVHGTMKEACRSFKGGTLKSNIAKGLPTGFQVPLEVQAISDTFYELQDRRHRADYDLTERFNRSDVKGLVRQVEAAIRRFKSLAASDDKKFFLACLWAWKELSIR